MNKAELVAAMAEKTELSKKDKEILEEVLVHLRTMRDTWKEVMKLAHSK